MTKQPPLKDADRVDAAFNRVLAAEAEARERVEDCRREAAEIVSAGVLRARAISDATDRRMGLVHRIADRGVERSVAAILGEARARALDQTVAADPERLDRLVEAMADEILGAVTGGS
jgi:vacuolar-type H+-ATPase subunit H